MSFSFLLRRDGLNQVDYQIKGGKIQISLDSDAVRDRLFTALSTQLGEWFLDADDGVAYINGILGGKMTEAEVGARLRRRILLDPDVNRVVSLDVIQENFRHVTVNAEVELLTGEPITIEV